MRHLLFVLALVFPLQALGVTYSYTYTGKTLLPATPADQATVNTYGLSTSIAPFSGVLRINDTFLPGRTIANQSLSGALVTGDKLPAWMTLFSVTDPTRVVTQGLPAADGIVRADIFNYSLRTDSVGRILSWDFWDFEDRRQSYQLSNAGGDIYSDPYPGLLAGNSLVANYNAPPGTWSDPTVVPIPGALASMLFGLGLLGFAHRRRSAA